MRSFPKLLARWLVTAAVPGALVTGALAQKKGDERTEGKDKKKAGEKGAKEKKNKDGKAKEKGGFDIPVSKGNDALGLRIPYIDGDGKKQMFFTIGVASRIDEDHIGMTGTKVETFDESGEPELTIDLPKSTLNVTTSVLSTKKHVLIKRDDFEISGETMEFNMKTKQGTLGGRVRMLIYNIQEQLAAAPESKNP